MEQEVAGHYARPGLEGAILDALRASGKDVGRLIPDDLSGVDEFHLGWRTQTVAFAKSLGLTSGMHVLDVGAGIGGPGRYFADAHGCTVTGIDLTEDYVRVANALTRRCGLSDRVVFTRSSALALPFADGAIDVATLVHVGMNIPDKTRLFAEIRRVLKLGGRFGVYDVMRIGDAPIPYPTPWAASAETSFVEPPEVYRRLLQAAGFEIETESDRRGLTLELGRAMRERAARHGPPPLGLHILMGPAAPQRLGNLMSAVEAAIVAPIEIIARAV